ncbi:MAG: hypothetical protein ABIF71_10685 [Planctomycetota bacterium]
MNGVLEFCRGNPVLTLAVAYAVAGRMAILIAAVVPFIPLALAVTLVIGLELIQIPVLYHGYGLIGRIYRRFRPVPPAPSGAPEKANRGFLHRFRSRGGWGVFILAGLPFKGCGVWSSLLLGRMLVLPRLRLYLIVAGATVLGDLALGACGIGARQAAAATVRALDLPPAVQALWQ